MERIVSIINQTLKELDRRQGQQRKAQASVAYQPRRASWALRIAVFAGVVLLAAIFVLLLLDLLRGSDAEAEMRIEPALPAAQSVTAETEQPAAEMNETTVVPILLPATRVHTREQSPEQTVAAVPESDKASTQTAESGSSSDSGAEPETTAHSADTEDDENVGQMQVQRVERDAGELAQQKLDRALELIDQGEGRRAEQLLQEALVLNPESVATRQQLAAYYYGRGFSSQALRLLREGLSYAPNNTRLVMLTARIYEESNRPGEALRVLKGVRTELPQNADLITLRGALANETGDYAEAASSYQALVDWRPTNGVWWLGLGIARDYLNEPLAATAAYREALNDPNLNEDSRRFALQRLEAL